MMQFSYWEQHSFLQKPDIIIAGAGLMGLWTALELKKSNSKLSILIIERSSIPIGASTRNAGFACFGSPSELLSDVEKSGEDAMWQLVEMRYKGIQKILHHFNQQAIDYNGCNGYEVYKKQDETITKVSDKLSWLNAGMKSITGSAETFAWCNHKLQQQQLTGFEAMIENSFEGSLHSGKLVQQLIKLCTQNDIQLLFSVELKSWNTTATGVEVNTSLGKLYCHQLILATNAFTHTICDADIQPGRGQVIVTSEIPHLQLNGTFHFDEGFYYFRNVGNRVLLGGARNLAFDEETTLAFEVSSSIQAALQDFLKEHILQNQSYTIDYRWSGIMGFTSNKKPLLQLIDKNVVAVSACNGMGVALSPIMAEQVLTFVKDI